MEMLLAVKHVIVEPAVSRICGIITEQTFKSAVHSKSALVKISLHSDDEIMCSLCAANWQGPVVLHASVSLAA